MKYRKCPKCKLYFNTSWHECPRCKSKLTEWEGEICQKCFKPYRLGYDVLDSIWKQIAEEYNLLCLDCFDEMAKEKNIKYEAKTYWAGFGELIKEVK